MNNDQGYYAVIPAYVLTDENLTDSEKLLYATISTLVKKEGYCWASNKWLAEKHGVSPRTIQRYLRSLKDQNYIDYEVVSQKGNKRKIYLTPLTTNLSPPHDKNDVTPHDKFVTHSNTSISNKTKYKEKSKKKDPSPGKKSTTIPPEPDWVSDYFEDRGLSASTAKTETEKFFDHYESVGWKVGKNKMKNWQAAVRQWCRRMSKYKTKNGAKNGQSQADRYFDIGEELFREDHR